MRTILLFQIEDGAEYWDLVCGYIEEDFKDFFLPALEVANSSGAEIQILYSNHVDYCMTTIPPLTAAKSFQQFIEVAEEFAKHLHDDLQKIWMALVDHAASKCGVELEAYKEYEKKNKKILSAMHWHGSSATLTNKLVSCKKEHDRIKSYSSHCKNYLTDRWNEKFFNNFSDLHKKYSELQEEIRSERKEMISLAEDGYKRRMEKRDHWLKYMVPILTLLFGSGIGATVVNAMNNKEIENCEPKNGSPPPNFTSPASNKKRQ